MKPRVDPWKDTRETSLEIGGRTFELVHPSNSDDLITEEDYVKDERLPYWADIWPASRVLAAQLLQMTGANRSLIELGCGLGLVSAAAVHAGFEVVATDYYADALSFARHNVRRATGTDIATRLLDWRKQLPPDFSFDVAVASDVLYEKEYATLLAGLFSSLVRPTGRVFVADPGRVAAPEFLVQATYSRLQLRSHRQFHEKNDGKDIVVDLYEFERMPNESV